MRNPIAQIEDAGALGLKRDWAGQRTSSSDAAGGTNHQAVGETMGAAQELQQRCIRPISYFERTP
jgi:hypothetical protein